MTVVSRFKLSALIGALCILSSATPSWATRFYVDQTHGTDKAAGTSPQTAWQHLGAVSRYAREHHLKPGDSILLKSGERWREQLDLSDIHGTQSSAITIGSYGTGDYPTIDAADLTTSWTRVSDGVYQAPTTDDIYKVLVDGNDRPTNALSPVFNFSGEWQSGKHYGFWDAVTKQGKNFVVQQPTSGDQRFQPADWFRISPYDVGPQVDGMTAVAKTLGSWWYDAKAKRLLVHTADGSNPASHSMQTVTRRYGIRLVGSSHVVVEGLRIVHAAKSGIFAAVADTSLADPSGDNQANTVQNCIFWNVGDTTSDYSASLDMSGEAAVFVASGTGAARGQLTGWTIKDNAVGTVDSHRGLAYERAGILITGTSGLILQNNYVATGTSMGISVVSDHGPACTSPSIVGNYLTNNDGNLRVSGCAQPLIDGNTIELSYGYGLQIGGNSPGAKVVRNSIHNIERNGQENAYNGVDCNGGAPGGTMSQNSIGGVWGAEATFEIGCSNWTIERNLFDSSANMKGGGLTLYIRRESMNSLQFRDNTYRLNSSTTRQFNYGAGQPGAQTFHDFSWWQQNVETSAHLGGTANLVAVNTSRSPAATAYLRVAAPVHWEP